MEGLNVSKKNRNNTNTHDDVDSDKFDVYVGGGQQHAKRRVRATADSSRPSLRSPDHEKIRGGIRIPYQRRRPLVSRSTGGLLSRKPLSILISLIIALTLIWFLLARTIFTYPHTEEVSNVGILRPDIEKLEQSPTTVLREVPRESTRTQNHLQLMEQTQKKISLRNEKRRQRTLPVTTELQSQLFEHNEFVFPYDEKSWSIPESDEEDEEQSNPCGIHAQRAPSSNFQKRDELNSNSHVLVTGVLNSIGFHLVMALRERCGVEHIYGIDPMFPNTVIHRLHYLQPKLSILTDDKWMWLPLPYVGLEAKRKHKPKKSEIFLGDTTQELHWLRSYPKITHIVHLATSQPAEDHYHYDHGNSPTSESRTSVKFSLRQSMTSMEQLLHSMAHLVQHDESEKGAPHLVYASTLPNENEDKNMFTAAKQIDEQLVKTYHNIHDIFSVGLRFSHVYGPWGNPGTEYYDLAEIAVRHWHDEGTINAPRDFENYSMLFNLASDTKKKKNLVTEKRDFVFVDDAVDAIIAAMQFRTKESVPAVFNIASGKSVAMKYIADIMESMMPIPTEAKDKNLNDIGESNDTPFDDASKFLSWSSDTSLRDGIRQLLSWHLDKHLPFGQSPYENHKHAATKIAAHETGHTFSNRLEHSPCDIEDETCLRYKHVFPCASECSEDNVCSKSIFDPIIKLSREISEDCDVVVYTDSLGREVVDLLLKAELQPNEDFELDFGEDVICNMAFVPRESKLAKLAVESITDAAMERIDIQADKITTVEEKYDVLNGRLLHKGWVLIWVPEAVGEIRIDEFSLLKLSPSKMLHPSVKYAMFMDEFFSVSANLDDVRFMVNQMSRKALPERSVSHKVDNRKRKFILPAEPERKCALLLPALKPIKSNDKNEIHPKPGAKIPLKDAIKYMLFEQGIDTSKSTPPAVKKQKEFYQKIPTYVNKQDLRSILDPKYNYNLNHWARTRFVVHDLTIEEGRQLRCEWYKEHIHWENDLDQLSFAHVMAQRETERRIARKEPDDHEREQLEDDMQRVLSDKHEWYLLLNDMEENESGESYRPIHNNEAGHEEDDEVNQESEEEEEVEEEEETEMTNEIDIGIYTRIISEAVMVQARHEWTKEQEKINKKKKRNKRAQEKKKVHNVNGSE